MRDVALIIDLVRAGRATPTQGARLLELRRELKQRRAGRFSRLMRFLGHWCGAD